jgi:hypothetical protein
LRHSNYLVGTQCMVSFVSALMLGTGLAMFSVDACADTAEVLPKGVSRYRVEGQFYENIDERYNQDGHKEPIAHDFNTRLDSSVFSALSLIDDALQMPGFSSIGDSVVDIDYDVTIMNMYYEYGVTNKVSFGIKVPYWWVDSNVKAKVDNTNATVGKNTNYTGMPGDSPVLPLAVPGVEPITTADVQQLLGDGLDVNGDGSTDIPGFGYDRFGSRSDYGLSDVELGFRYQYFNNDDWRLAVTTGVRLPTGETDLPYNLSDFGSSDGTTDLLLRLNQDYMGIKNTILSATLKYDLQGYDTRDVRVPPSVDIVLTDVEESVQIDYGDIYGYELSFMHSLFGGPFSLYAGYENYKKKKNSANGDSNISYDSLEDESNWEEEVLKLGVGFSTLGMYKAKEFPVPLEVSLLYRDRFDGRNNALVSKYYQLAFAVYW